MTRETHNRKYDAIINELGYDPSENDEWNTYASDDDFEESNYGEFIA